MKQTAPIRQAIAAEQIVEAMKKRGLGKKQFAELMGRNPSEVTKWLSGKHNFTIALLQEISEALGSDITGVEDIDALVGGYGIREDEQTLAEPAAVYGSGYDLSGKIRRRSADLGMSARQYIERLVDEDLRNSGTLPRIELPLPRSEEVEKYAGIMKTLPSQDELDGDERLSRIWNR
ncbi:MAG: helix-turn-helix domain-containing protein [Candidatus Cryptobacteroides sp.]